LSLVTDRVCDTLRIESILKGIFTSPRTLNRCRHTRERKSFSVQKANGTGLA